MGALVLDREGANVDEAVEAQRAGLHRRGGLEVVQESTGQRGGDGDRGVVRLLCCARRHDVCLSLLSRCVADVRSAPPP